MKNKVIGIVCLAALLLSCASSMDTSSADNKITEKYWKLVSLNGNEITWSEGQEREAHIILKNKDQQLTGSTGCNLMGGTYVLTGKNKVDFSKLYSTKMYCEGVEYEQEFLTALGNAAEYKIEDDVLYLYDESGTQSTKMQAIYLQ